MRRSYPPGLFAARRDRLEKAAQLADERIADGDLAAAYVLIQLLPLLESLDDKARCLAAT